MSQIIETKDENATLSQRAFDVMYITSSEIRERLGVQRPAMHFRRAKGKLPGAIEVYGQQLLIWERAAIEPHLQEWEREIKARSGAAV